MCGAHGLWHNEIEGVSDGFRCAIAEERLCPTIPQANHSVPSTKRTASGACAISAASRVAAFMTASDPFACESAYSLRSEDDYKQAAAFGKRASRQPARTNDPRENWSCTSWEGVGLLMTA